MFVNFKKLSFKNVLSYGNKVTEIDFTKGLNLLAGKNAQGKSTIIDALSFSLYGVPYRKIKIKELINRKNQRGMNTEIDFFIDKNEYKICRGLNPNKLEVYKNGEKLELLSSKKLTQTEIDKIIGVNYNLFRQIISLAINVNKPYLSLPIADKRDIIESIFNIKIFGEMLRVLKKKNTGLKLQSEYHKKDLELIEHSMRGMDKQIKEMKRAQKDFDRNKEKEIKEFQKRINSYTREKENFKDQIIKAEEKKENIETGGLNELNIEIEKSQADINIQEYVVKRAEKDIKIINQYENCPVCKQDMTKDHKKKELIRLKIRIEKAKELLSNLTIRKESFNKTKEKLEKNIDRFRRLKTKIQICTDKTNFLENQIQISTKNKSNAQDRKLNFNIEDIRIKKQDKQDEYTKNYLEHISNLKTLKQYNVIQKILSDNGIKSYFFKKLIPLLNSKINEYLNKFDLPIQLIFNELMEEEIKNFGSSSCDDVSYFSMSEGEKKRVDMSILFSFIDITKTICNWNCNLIIMDELLDSSIDESGMDKLIASIKNMIEKSNDTICVYIISHRLLESELFENIYEIQKTSGFSKIKKIRVST